MKPVIVTDEDFEQAMRQLEDEERWRAAHSVRRVFIDALDHIISSLEHLQNRLRWW